MGGGSSKDKPSALSRFRGAKTAMKKKFLSTIEEVEEPPQSKMSTFDSQVSQTNLLEIKEAHVDNNNKPFPGDEPHHDAAKSAKPAPLHRQLSS